MKIVQFVVSVHFFEDNHTVVPSEAKVVTALSATLTSISTFLLGVNYSTSFLSAVFRSITARRHQMPS